VSPTILVLPSTRCDQVFYRSATSDGGQRLRVADRAISRSIACRTVREVRAGAAVVAAGGEQQGCEEERGRGGGRAVHRENSSEKASAEVPKPEDGVSINAARIARPLRAVRMRLLTGK
jgi:hypothetical protein